MIKKIYKFSAEWCGPCKKLEPIFNNIAKMQQFQTIDFYTCDVDEDQNQALIDKYNIRNIPTIVFADENGNEIKRLVGAIPLDTIIKTIQNI